MGAAADKDEGWAKEMAECLVGLAGGAKARRAAAKAAAAPPLADPGFF